MTYQLKQTISLNFTLPVDIIQYLIEDDPPQPEGKRGVPWLIQLHPSLHEKAIEVVKSNYPSKTAFVRLAVCKQLIYERMLDEETENLKIDNRKFRNKIHSLQSDGERLAENYYDLLRDFRQLKKEKEKLEKQTTEQKPQ